MTENSINVVNSKLVLGKKDFGKDFCYECNFCKKIDNSQSEYREMCEKLSGTGYYCAFCLRNGFFKKSNHVLGLSFRAIFGYLYYGCYAARSGRKKTMWLSEIEDRISKHEETGLKNPTFYYDPETLMWFVDFSKISKIKKLQVESVLKTISDILKSISLPEEIDHDKLYCKYSQAVIKFYSTRSRPQNKMFLIPTVQDCGPSFSKQTIEKSRNFTGAKK